MERSYADLYERSRRQKAKGAFKKVGTWLWGALGVGAFLGGYAAAVFNEVAPAPRVAKELVCQLREWRAEPARGIQFTILISNLAGDGDGSQTNRVREIFLGQRGLDVRSTCRVVALDAIGGSVADAEAEALAEGRALLEDRNADLLIWGEVKKADQELSLWFLSAENSTLGRPSYSLTKKVTLPENFQADLGAQLEAVAIAQIAPATEEAGTYLVRLLTPIRAKLEQLVANPPPGLSDEQRENLRFSLALAAQTIGDQGGENGPLEAAVREYREVLEVRTRERVPRDWAMTQNSLGLALVRLGEREDGTERLQQAVVAFRAALEISIRERMPLDWAMTQNNLGLALWRLGEREESTELLKEAVVAHRAALEVRTRDRVPLDWATTQNSLGNSLAALGEREDSTERLEEAAAAYRAALEVRTRERVPLDWAKTQNNLGTALRTLGEREEGTERLEEALAAFRAALEIRTRERVPLQWAMTQNNLGNVLRTLGAREGGTPRLEQAVQAYRAALEVYSRERVALDWAMTQSNLGTALSTLAEREDGTQRLEEAVQAYRAALEVRTRERYPLLWALTQESVGLALMTLGVRQGSVRRLEEAVDAISAALPIFESAHATHNMNRARANLARAEALLVERRAPSVAE